MSTMDLFVIFGQRKERYAGEFAPEALDVADEWCMDENPGWISGKLEEHRSSGEFEAVEIVRLAVDMDAVMARLRPTVAKAIPTQIKG